MDDRNTTGMPLSFIIERKGRQSLIRKRPKTDNLHFLITHTHTPNNSPFVPHPVIDEL